MTPRTQKHLPHSLLFIYIMLIVTVPMLIMFISSKTRSSKVAIAAAAQPYSFGSEAMSDDAEAEAIVVNSIEQVGITAVENLPRIGDDCVIEVDGGVILLVTRIPRPEDLPTPSETAITTRSPMPPPPPPPSGDTVPTVPKKPV